MGNVDEAFVSPPKEHVLLIRLESAHMERSKPLPGLLILARVDTIAPQNAVQRDDATAHDGV
jgi:hypothetical protein